MRQTGWVVGLSQTGLVGVVLLGLLGFAGVGVGRGFVGFGEAAWLLAGGIAVGWAQRDDELITSAWLGTLVRLSLLVGLPLWGLLVNAWLLSNGGQPLGEALSESGVHLVFAAHGLGVAAWIAARRHPEELPWRQEALLLSGLVIGGLTSGLLTLHFHYAPLIAWILPWAGPPLWAPIVCLFFFTVAAVGRLDGRGRRRLARMDAEEAALLSEFGEASEPRGGGSSLVSGGVTRGLDPLGPAIVALVLLWAALSAGVGGLSHAPGLYGGAFDVGRDWGLSR